MKSALLFILNDPLFYGFVFAGLAIGVLLGWLT